MDPPHDRGGERRDRARPGASHAEVTPDHLLAALLGQADTVVLPVLAKVGVAPLALRNQAERRSASWRGATAEATSQRRAISQRVLEAAVAEQQNLGDEYLSTEHLLLALAERIGVVKDDLLAALRDVRGSHRITSADPESTFQALEKYGRDLTAEARKGKLDPVIGRDEEIRRVIQVLSRGEPRTTRCSSASRASARPRSSTGSPTGSSKATYPRVSSTSASCRSTWARWSRGPSTAASSRSASRPS